MTKLRKLRNLKIKAEVLAELELGLILKEALYAVAERHYLSKKQLERIYYDTRIE
jgi:hypothetical protein